MSIERIFKPHILNSGGYEGGASASKDSGNSKVYKLSSNENILGTALENYSDHLEHPMNIYPPPTPQLLYDALEKQYKGELTASQFIAGNGGSDILQILSMGFLDSSTNCIISNPCFGPYRMFSEWMGAEVRDIPLLSPNFSLDVSGIIEAVDGSTRMIYLTSPNNPTGSYISTRDLDQLVSSIPDHVVIVYDEVYHHFADVADYTRGLPYLKKGINIIAINSFSKAYGMAGLRLGYAYTSELIASYLRKILRPFLINQISLSGAIQALDNSSFLTHTKNTISTQRLHLQSRLDEMGIKHWKSQGNFILIDPQMDSDRFTQLMSDHHIMVRPTTNFGAPGCIRLTIGDSESTQASLQALATILKK